MTLSTLQRRPPLSLRLADVALAIFARAAAGAVILLLGALIVVLVAGAFPSIRAYGPKFLNSTQWCPNERSVPRRDTAGKVLIEDGEVVMEVVPPAFGAAPFIYGTAVSSLLALLLAVPLSLGTALFLARIAPKKLAAPISFLVEFLAAIPSIAFGLWGLFILAPFLQKHVEPWFKTLLGGVPGFGWMFRHTFQLAGTTVTRPLPLTGRDMFCGGIILAIMILPILTALSRDVLKAVPKTQVEASLALGATWWQSARAMFRHAKGGLFGAVLLGLARAAGETMALTMVIGNSNRIIPSLFAPAQTMSSLLANQFVEADTPLFRAALCEIALVLLAMSLAFNLSARWLVRRKA